MRASMAYPASARVRSTLLSSISMRFGRGMFAGQGGRRRRPVTDIAGKPTWVIEGVYGWLARVALPRATISFGWTCHGRNVELVSWSAAYDEG